MLSGVRVDPLSEAEFTRAIDAFLRDGKSHVVHFLAAHPLALARRDARYRQTLNRGDINLPDGMAVSWALRLERRRARRFPGAEGMRLLSGWGVPRGVRHYLYGGRPEVTKRLGRELNESHPGIVIAGACSPPFRARSAEELRADARRIRMDGTDLLWVGLGTPKQDIVAERLRQLDAAPVILCVGAAFDFLSGAKRRAPRWMQRSGLEWLHRLASEPRRLWRRYLIQVPHFALGVLWDHLPGGLGSRLKGGAR